MVKLIDYLKHNDMKKMKFIVFVSLLFGIMGCLKDATHQPLDTNGNAPGPVKDAIVKNMPGGAEITYTLPKDENLLYVRAEYEVNGVKKEAKSSFYKKTVLVEGYGDVNEHKVTLYAVSRGEKASTPVEVAIKPLTPSLIKVRQSLTAESSFGGFTVKFKNEDLANIVMVALLWNSAQKEWKQIDANYTAMPEGVFKVRGQQSILQTFGVFIKDRWGNLSDTLKFDLVPIYEIQLDYTKFADIRKKYPIPQLSPLPTSGLAMIEAVDYSSSYPMKNLYDGNTSSMFHTKQNVDQPVWIPINLGVKARLSRYKIWQRTGSFYYSHGNPHEWEIWGTNTPSDVNSWVRLDHQIMIKPSGLPVGVNSNEDISVADAGQEYDFPENIPTVQYIAWKNVDCWGAIQGQTGFFHLFELSIWGQVQ
jgi:hypothetical protein